MVDKYKEQLMLFGSATLALMALLLMWLLFASPARAWKNSWPKFLGGCACADEGDPGITMGVKG